MSVKEGEGSASRFLYLDERQGNLATSGLARMESPESC